MTESFECGKVKSIKSKLKFQMYWKVSIENVLRWWHEFYYTFYVIYHECSSRYIQNLTTSFDISYQFFIKRLEKVWNARQKFLFKLLTNILIKNIFFYENFLSEIFKIKFCDEFWLTNWKFGPGSSIISGKYYVSWN